MDAAPDPRFDDLLSASEKRSKCRFGIGTPSSDLPETMSNSTLSLPKKSASAFRTAPLKQLWPDG